MLTFLSTAVRLIHALGFATFGVPGVEPRFGGNSTFSELGLALEEHLFSGRFTDSRSIGLRSAIYLDPRKICVNAPRRPFKAFGILGELPSQATEAAYAAVDPKYTRSGLDGPICDVMWRVPFAFFQQLYSPKFWEHVARNEQMNALHPPKVGGFVFHTDWANGVVLEPVSFQDASVPRAVRDKLRSVLDTEPDDDLEHFACKRYHLRG